MSRTRKLPIVAITGCLFLTSAARLSAQSDAETALNDARKAYAANQFEVAHQSAHKASQTDADNPDVFLLLGKAHFQLGELDQAMVAWQTVLKLAPNHEYAQRMVNALQGRSSDADVRIRLSTRMVSDGLLPAAQAELHLLRRRTSLSTQQRQAVLMLLAEIAVHRVEGDAALALIAEVTIKNGDAADTLPVRLLTARARLRLGAESAKPGLDELAKLAEGFADSAEGKAAALELLLHHLADGEDTVKEVAAWIEQNADSPSARRARIALYTATNAFLAASAAEPPPEIESELNAHDQSALAAAEHAFQSFTNVSDQIALAKAVSTHLEKRYTAANAYTAARNGLTLLAEIELPASVGRVLSISRERLDEAEATYEYSQITQGVADAVESPDALKTWIKGHVGHPYEIEARRALVAAYLKVTTQQSAPRPDAGLTEADHNAVVAAGELIAKLKTATEVSKVAENLAEHFQKRYFDRGAQAAGIAGVTAVLALEAPKRRGLLLSVLLKMQSEFAIAELKKSVAAGTVPATTAPMPVSLAQAAATAVEAIAANPARVSWMAHATLAQEVLEAGGTVPWPTRISGPKATQGWALSLALPVVKANADAASVKAARDVVDRVVNELAAVAQPTAAGLATSSHEQLMQLLPLQHELWAEVMLRHVDLLTADASRVYDANIRAGEATKNAKLTKLQESILQLLSEVVQQRPSLAPTALQKLNLHLKKWSAAHHDAVVEAAYQSFRADLPPVAQRQTTLALASMWFNQVLREHTRVAANGFQVPRQLDERAHKALQQCYELIGSVGPGDPLRVNVGLLRKRIVDHYLALEYDEIAELAIRVKADVADADLDEGAELEIAAIKRRIADRQLAKQLRQHDGKKQIVLTPAFNEAIAALQKFITDHPGSERVPAATNGVFAIGRTFEKHDALSIAAGIYKDFEQFAGQLDSLQQGGPRESTYPEKAAMAYASALHTAASNALRKWKTEKADDAMPPLQLNDEFQAAQAAWHSVVTKYQQRPVAQAAISRSMSIATEYAALNAWDVADGVYATILELQLPLQSPERLEFGRAISQLGKVLPDHARTVLAAVDVVNARRRGDADEDGEALIALGAFGTMSRDRPQGVALNAQVANQAIAAPRVSREASDSYANEPAMAAVAEAPTASPGGGMSNERKFQRDADTQLIAAVRTQLDRQASQVAMLRDDAILFRKKGQQRGGQTAVPVPGQPGSGGTVLSDAELLRQQTVLDAVYTALQDIRKKHADSTTATQSRSEIFVIVNHWREIAQWNRAAELSRRFLADNPADIELPKIRQEAARDWLAWASLRVRDSQLDREELLAEIAGRFETARDELQAIVVAFPDETVVRHQAQWDIATSFLTQARVVTASSPTLARGQFVRAATELLRVAELFHDHPKIATIPDMLWGIGSELATRNYHDEAITVWNELQIHYPTHKLSDQSALQIAKTWQQLGQPLRAAEAFLELNFSRGGTDAELQNTIYQIAVDLKTEKRWIESLHVLQTFVDSFPAHANAGQSLTMIGQIHQANEVWEDAIAAYRRVIDEFPTGAWTTEARWSIAECTINLSLWHDASVAYAEFQQSYPKDSRVAEAARRIEVLKTLDRYQDVIDEEGQRKAFDAQFQVAVMVRTELTNSVKAIIEYRKVEQNWPQSHLADDALFEIGKIYLELGETELARTALLQSAERYPKSPLADDALLLVGTSFVSEADQLAAVDRGKSQAIAKDITQRQAYQVAQDNRKRHITRNSDQIALLKVQGKREEAANKEAYFAGQALQFDAANTLNVSNWAAQQEEVLSAAQMADRQDKINAALRQAVGSFRKAASVNAADKADDALLQMARIYDERLKDSVAAMSTWEEIVRQYSGTTVAEDASWKMARYFENQKEYQKAIAAYQTFFRNYRRSPRAGEAQAAIAENHEQLGEWIEAMDAYTNYVNNFPQGPLLKKAQDQISWIKTYRL